MNNLKLREIYDLIFCSTASTFILGCIGSSPETASNHYIIIDNKSINLSSKDWLDILTSTKNKYIGKGDSELYQGSVEVIKKKYIYEFRLIKIEKLKLLG
jgi:hypothetical protein